MPVCECLLFLRSWFCRPTRLLLRHAPILLCWGGGLLGQWVRARRPGFLRRAASRNNCQPSKFWWEWGVAWHRGAAYLDPSAGLCFLPASDPLELSFIVPLFPPADWEELGFGGFPELMLAFAATLAEEAMAGGTGVVPSYSGRPSCHLHLSALLLSESGCGDILDWKVGKQKKEEPVCSAPDSLINLAPSRKRCSCANKRLPRSERNERQAKEGAGAPPVLHLTLDSGCCGLVSREMFEGGRGRISFWRRWHTALCNACASPEQD